MNRHPITRTLLLLLRDARGRFTRIRTAIPKKPARRHARRRRLVLAAVQLALF